MVWRYIYVYQYITSYSPGNRCESTYEFIALMPKSHINWWLVHRRAGDCAHIIVENQWDQALVAETRHHV